MSFQDNVNVKNLSCDSVANGIQEASEKSAANNMQWNHDKTVILNIVFSKCKGINEPIPYSDTTLFSAQKAKL